MPQNTAKLVLKDSEREKGLRTDLLLAERNQFFHWYDPDTSRMQFGRSNEKKFNQNCAFMERDVRYGAVLNMQKIFPHDAVGQVVIVKEAQSIVDLGKKRRSNYLISYLVNPLRVPFLVLSV